MKFQDEGYIINLRKYGESSLILTVLTREHGKLVGFVKHCLNKKNLAVFQLGNLVAVDVYARLDENMPSLRVELISPTAVNFMDSSANSDRFLRTSQCLFAGTGKFRKFL